MIKKLTPIGNSHGLVIDKSILEILKITPDTELELSTDGTRLIIEPLRAKRRRPAPAAPRVGRPLEPPRPERRYGFPKKQPW
jgi:antitoxin component of MazEF toxin-antitoxin module